MRNLILTTAFCLASSAHAVSPQMVLANQESQALSMQLDTCAIQVSTIYVLQRSKGNPEGIDVAKCVDEGKASVKAAFEKIRSSFGKKKVPTELVDWRLEWMTGFDAALPQPGEIERAYIQRQTQSKQAITRATNKLEIALE